MKLIKEAIIMDANNCRKTTLANISSTVKITELISKPILSIYPNPTKSTINIKLIHSENNNGVLKITNTLGQVILNKKTKGNNLKQSSIEFNLSKYNYGVYYISFTTQNLSLIKKDRVRIKFLMDCFPVNTAKRQCLHPQTQVRTPNIQTVGVHFSHQKGEMKSRWTEKVLRQGKEREN